MIVVNLISRHGFTLFDKVKYRPDGPDGIVPYRTGKVVGFVLGFRNDWVVVELDKGFFVPTNDEYVREIIVQKNNLEKQ